MRIAIISDTHDRLRETLVEQIRTADEIWHLGDVCANSILDEIDALGPQLIHVRGNCDHDMTWPLSRCIERAGHICYLIHIPPREVPPAATVVLHGHTHKPRHDIVENRHWLNPGSAGLANKGAPLSFAWLTLEADGYLQWEIVLLD